LKFYKISVWLLLAFSCQWLIASELTADAADGQIQMRTDICIGCHLEQHKVMTQGAHWVSGDSRTPVNLKECSTCHGDTEEHVLSAGEAVELGLKSYTPKNTRMTPPEQNAVCQACHKESALLHWETSGHASADVGCVGCHRMHQEDRVLAKRTQSGVCYECHTDVRLQDNKPYGHPIRQQKMTCTDCHGPHGGPGDAGMKTFAVNDTCFTCHAEHRGPFLWEHAPVSDNCVLCHTAHGSMHAGMLNRRAPQLCQSCHEPIGGAGTQARHSRLALSYRHPGGVDIGPSPPGIGISRLVLGESCMNCHSKVHGSNHPAGATLAR